MTTTQSSSAHRTFKATTNSLLILALLLTFGYYFASLVLSESLASSTYQGKLFTATLSFLLLQLGIRLVVPLLFPQVARAETGTLHTQAALKAYQATYYVLLAGVFTSLTLSIMSIPAYWVVQNLVLFFVISEASRYVVELVLLQRS